MDTFFLRMRNSFKLDFLFYTQVAHNSTLDRESFCLMIVSGILSFASALLTSGGGTDGVLVAAGIGVTMVIVFFAQTILTHRMGRLFFRSSASYIEAQRAFSYTFFWSVLLNLIPCVGLLSGPWFLAARYVATRGALQIEKGAAFTIFMLSFLLSYGMAFLFIASFVNVPTFFNGY